MTYTAHYTNPEHTSIARSDMPGASIPVAPGNRHYNEILTDGIVIADYVAPPDVPDGYLLTGFDPLVGGWIFKKVEV